MWNACLTMTVTCQRHLISTIFPHLPAPHVPLCPTPVTHVKGAPVSIQGTLSAHKWMFSEASGLAVQVSPSQPHLCIGLGKEGCAPKVWGEGQQGGSLLSGAVADRCAGDIADYNLLATISDQPLHLCTWAGSDPSRSHPGASHREPPSRGTQSLNFGTPQP